MLLFFLIFANFFFCNTRYFLFFRHLKIAGLDQWFPASSALWALKWNHVYFLPVITAYRFSAPRRVIFLLPSVSFEGLLEAWRGEHIQYYRFFFFFSWRLVREAFLSSYSAPDTVNVTFGIRDSLRFSVSGVSFWCSWKLSCSYVFSYVSGEGRGGRGGGEGAGVQGVCRSALMIRLWSSAVNPLSFHSLSTSSLLLPPFHPSISSPSTLCL